MASHPADEALKRLVEGNKRFSDGTMSWPNQGKDRRLEVTAGQKPFAIVLGCSDSRIPPEIIFDQGIGDLFIIRVAGNIIDDVALGSIEYAADHLGTPLFVVLGHGACGAVTATAQGGEAHGHIGSIMNRIVPALEKAKGKAGDLVDNAIRENVYQVVAQAGSTSPILSKLVGEGKLKIVGAYYDIHTGVVEFFQ